jgi:ABC-type molybdate transport system substrate-binding protein
MPKSKTRLIASLGITIVSLALTYIPIPGVQKTVIVVSGTELQEPLEELEPKFEQAYPNIDLELEFQGSQDIVNNYIDRNNNFDPTVVIPANAKILEQLSDRWRSQHQTDPFLESPRPIAKTMLVAIAWAERGQILFPDGRFDWNRVEAAMNASGWGQIGGNPEWGSFDFVTTNPTRSNSGQLTLSLWARSKLGGQNLNTARINQPQIQSLVALVKRSVYLPPRSTDTLLQEFIARGPNEADVATVYESIALHRWEQSGATQDQPYQIYYLDPTIETVSTAAIVRRNVDRATAKAASQFLDFLTAPEQQATFVQYGFRPGRNNINLNRVPNSPWAKSIPGANATPPTRTLEPPEPPILSEIQRLWERAN